MDLEVLNSGIVAEQIGLVLLPVCGAGLGRFLCGKAIPDGRGRPVDARLLSQFFLPVQSRLHRFQSVSAFLKIGKGGGDGDVQFLR